MISLTRGTHKGLLSIVILVCRWTWLKRNMRKFQVISFRHLKESFSRSGTQDDTRILRKVGMTHLQGIIIQLDSVLFNI
jgi:hypothetical protein